MITFKIRFCCDGSILSAEDNKGREICQYAIGPTSTNIILDVIGQIINKAEPIVGNKIALVDIVPTEPKKAKRKKKGKEDEC